MPTEPATAALASPTRACLLLVLLLALLAAGGLGARLDGQALDDFYITYRYAQNLAAGHGFVFNPGERVFGTTEPGLGLLLAGLHRLTGVAIPRLGTALTAAAAIGLALLLAWHGARRQRFVEGWAAAALTVAAPLLWACQGSAGLPQLLLLALAVGLADRSELGAGLLAGAAVWLRQDGVLGVALLGLLLLLERRRLPWRFALGAGLVILVGLAGAGLYFGQLLPNTLAAKRAIAPWGSIATGLDFWPRIVPLLDRLWGPTWPLTVGLGLAGLPVLFRQGERLGRWLVLFGLGTALVYPCLGVPFAAWYTQAAQVALFTGLACGLGTLGRGLARAVGQPRWASVALAGLLLAPFVVGSITQTYGFYQRAAGTSPLVGYRDAARWVRERSPPGATIAALEVGQIAYFSERRIEDLMGLVTPRQIPFVRDRRVYEGFFAHPADYLIAKPGFQGLTGPLRQDPRFRGYRLATTVHPDSPFAVLVFARTAEIR
jgi:arabinofuranosyltransferase